MINSEIIKAILAGVEAKALYLGNTLVWKGEVYINLDTTDIEATVATAETGYAFTAKTFTTNPTGFENKVHITVDQSDYTQGMLLHEGTHTVTYTLNDDTCYHGDSKSFNVVVTVEEVEPPVIPVAIIVDTDPVTVQYAHDADYYDYTVKSFVTNPTGYEEDVVVKVNNEVYTNGMRLTEGTYSVSYTLADGEGYTGDTKTYTLTVTKEAAPSPEPEPEPEPEESFDIDIANFDLYLPGNGDRLDEPGTSLDPHEWSWWNNVSENETSHHTRECVKIENRSETSGGESIPSICVYIKPETITVGSRTFPAKTCVVYSRKLFPKGRIDIRANMMEGEYLKNSIWALSSTMSRALPTVVVDPSTNKFTAGPGRTLNYLYEFDVVEYTPGNPVEGTYGTNRAMWTWQANRQSLLFTGAEDITYNNAWCRVYEDPNDPVNPDNVRQGWQNNMLAPTGIDTDVDPLPWLFIGSDNNPHSLSNGLWYSYGTTGKWYLQHAYIVCFDGNKLKGHINGCYYFIKNYILDNGSGKPKVVRNASRNNTVSSDCLIKSTDLRWIKYDPANKTITEGSGLDGNDWFYAPLDISDSGGFNPHSIGTGKNIGGNIKGTDIIIGDWHTWSLEVTEDRVRYLCDDYAYIDQSHDNLYPLFPTGDFSCGLLLATNYPTDYYNAGYLPAADCMVINRIHFTPEDTSQ